MNVFNRLNLQQLFNWEIFITIFLAACLLIGLLYEIMSTYSNDYTNKHWQENANTFADSALYSVIIGSTSQSEAVVHNFAANNNVLKASIYNNQNVLLASFGSNEACNSADTTHADLRNAFFLDTQDFWCFYSPINQDNYLGHVEIIISKAEYKTVMRHLLIWSMVVILLFSVFIFFIVRHLSRFFIASLVEIASVLKKVSQGERGNRVFLSGSAEIDNIRVALNDMLTSIEFNEQLLEKRVTDRTSALKIALDSSETANIYKAQIMSMVSHEMKSPLHAIGGYLQVLAERLPDGPDYVENLALHSKALGRTNDLNYLIDNILLHAKLEADKFDLSFASFAIEPLMNVCVDNVTPLLIRNRNRLKLMGENMLFLSDNEVLRHIINNLLSNACKFTSDGDIAVDWQLKHGSLVIEVSDTGCGIPGEFHGNIFDAWWQVDMSLGRKYGGHGLGLAITKQFIQRLGGDISVTPNLKKGTVFTVRIPNSVN
jgi:signal transduction histidine kinase